MSQNIIAKFTQQAVWDLQAQEDARIFDILDDAIKAYEIEVERQVKFYLNNPEIETGEDITKYIYKIVKYNRGVDTLRIVLNKIWPEHIATLDKYLLLK